MYQKIYNMFNNLKEVGQNEDGVELYNNPSFRFSRDSFLELLQNDGLALAYVNQNWALHNSNDYYEIALEAVKQNGLALYTVNYIILSSTQYYQISLEAVKQNGLVLGNYVNEQILQNSEQYQYYEIVLAAVKQNGYALRHVDEKWVVQNSRWYYEVALEAVKQNGNVLDCINEIKSKDWVVENYAIVLAAVNENGSAVKYAGEIFRNNTKIIISSLINLDRKYSYDQIMRLNKIDEILGSKCKVRNDILIYIYILSNKNVSNKFKNALFDFFIKKCQYILSDKFTLCKNILEFYLILSEGYTKHFPNDKLLANLSDHDYNELYTFLSLADPFVLKNTKLAKLLNRNNHHNDIIKDYLAKDTHNLKCIKNFNIYSSFLPSNLFLVDYDKIIKKINIMKHNDLTQLVLDYLKIEDLLAFYKDKSKTKLEGQYVNIGLKFHGPESYTSIGVQALVDAIKLNKGFLSNTTYGKYDILDAKLLDLDLNLLQEY